ncbi:succinylglutamate desuccinylase [Photobacterium sanguinicancri]|uniref:succinylglutamate desuccinylase n=1 Tax=Photobacterium sanguinicancri TaxID=875932 RepID=UPI0021C267EE|nr:succinylglutamate desuccinylase [Photobacterium sanguinicancri]
MSSLDRVKAGEFLSATLDMDSVFVGGEWQLQSGVSFQLRSRGVLIIEPTVISRSTKSIIVSAGVHGDETGPIELLQQLSGEILKGLFEPAHRLLFIIAHPEATLAHTRFIAENMNRLFAHRNEPNNIDRKIANTLQQEVDHFYQGSDIADVQDGVSRWHLDLHSAIRDSAHYTFAVSPCSAYPTRSNALFAFLEQAEVEAVLLSRADSPTFSWYSASKYGAQALTMELGRVAKLGENDLERLSAFDCALRVLLQQEEQPYSWQGRKLIVYKVTRTITKLSDDFNFNFPASQANFTFFEQGCLLGQDQDKQYFSLEGGEAVVFPNPNVALGQRACLLVQQAAVTAEGQIKVV